MELAPAPVNFSEGVLVLQSSPSLPPGADDEQEREPEGLTLVELEDLQATASSAAAQAIAPKRSLNSNLWALSVNCRPSRRLDGRRAHPHMFTTGLPISSYFRPVT